MLNGERRALSPGTTVAALLQELGLNPLEVAVERNHDIVPRAQHDTTILATGDTLEIVTFVGGG